METNCLRHGEESHLHLQWSDLGTQVVAATQFKEEEGGGEIKEGVLLGEG